MRIIRQISEWNHQRLKRRAFAQRNKETPSYETWFEEHQTLASKYVPMLQQRIPDSGPTVSVIIPTYNPDLKHLELAIQSLITQTYPHIEICLADDASTDQRVRELILQMASSDSRIKYIFRTANGHIAEASNSALAIATGEWIAFMDQDDMLSPYAISCVVAQAMKSDLTSIIYSDEDKIDKNGKHSQPHFKPDWNKTLLLSQNYICHLVVIKKTVIDQVGGLRKGFEGAQDHDLLLRCSEVVNDESIVHLPFVLYHWRSHRASTSEKLESKPYALENGRRAVQDHLDRTGVRATVKNDGLFYRIVYEWPNPEPRVDVIIPTKDKPELLKRCVESVINKTSYPNVKFHIIDNGTTNPLALSCLDRITQNHRSNILKIDRPFNFSELNNIAAEKCDGSFLCLMNNDIEIIDPDWLQKLVAVCMQKSIGVVGCRLFYPDGTLQHAGVTLGIGGTVGHSFRGQRREDPHYVYRSMLMQELSAVTAACLITRTSLYRDIGGLNSEKLAVAFNDIDYCLRVKEAGWKVIYNPDVQFIHHESASRGKDKTSEQKKRLETEQQYFKKKWGPLLTADPAYNPNLSLSDEYFGLAAKPRTSLKKALLGLD